MTPMDVQLAGQAFKAAKDYADSIFKPSLKEIGGILSDTLGNWRLKNQVNFLLKTKKFLEDRGVSPTKLLPNVFVPLMDEAGNTDDETLSEMFARLLATHLDPSHQEDVHPSFAKTLGQLSPLDAKVLRCIDEKEEKEWKHRKDKGTDGPWAWSSMIVIEEMKKRLNSIGAGRVALSLTNLDRLGLTVDNTMMYELSAVATEVPGLRITKFGKGLLIATADTEKYWRAKFGDVDEKRFQMARADREKWESIKRENMKSSD